MSKPDKVMLPSKNANGDDTEIDVISITGLVCYEEPEKSDMAYLLSEG